LKSVDTNEIPAIKMETNKAPVASHVPSC